MSTDGGVKDLADEAEKFAETLAEVLHIARDHQGDAAWNQVASLITGVIESFQQ